MKSSYLPFLFFYLRRESKPADVKAHKPQFTDATNKLINRCDAFFLEDCFGWFS